MQTADTMTADDLTEFARRHFAAHPDHIAQDVFKAIRATGYMGVLQGFQIHEACDAARPTPTLTTVDEATALMRRLAARFGWVSVFHDRGWGDSDQKAEISIMVDGDGDMPAAWLTREVYAALVDQRIVGPDTYGGYKARRIHDFKNED
jgi:hypothetical protein